MTTIIYIVMMMVMMVMMMMMMMIKMYFKDYWSWTAAAHWSQWLERWVSLTRNSQSIWSNWWWWWWWRWWWWWWRLLWWWWWWKVQLLFWTGRKSYSWKCGNSVGHGEKLQDKCLHQTCFARIALICGNLTRRVEIGRGRQKWEGES